MRKGGFVRAGTGVMLAFGLSVLIAPGYADATSGDATREPASIMDNSCDFPTSVRPGSTYVTSSANCYTCLYNGVSAQARSPARTYYCVYNPGKDLNDLYYI